VKFIRGLSKLPELDPLIKSIGYFPILFGPKSETSILAKINEYIVSSIPSTAEKILAAYDRDPVYNNLERLPEFSKRLPAGASIKSFLHFNQLIKRKKWFGKYDYGKKANLKRYGQANPPAYDFSLIKTKVIAFSGQEDNFLAPDDILHLNESMKENGVDFTSISVPRCGHMTFQWGKSPIRIYNQIEEALHT